MFQQSVSLALITLLFLWHLQITFWPQTMFWILSISDLWNYSSVALNTSSLQSVFIELVLSGLGQHWDLLGCAFGGAWILNLLSSSCFAKASLLLPDLLGCGGPRRHTPTLGVIRNRLRAGGKATASMLWRQHISVRYSPSSWPDSYLIDMCTHCETACSLIRLSSFDIHSLIMS